MKSRRVASFAEEGKWTSGADSTMLIGDWQAWVDADGHWKVRGPDPDNEAHYADGDIELTEAEYTEAGNSEARRKIRATRAKKAARAYIQSMHPAKSSTRSHATKKTRAQLDREIAEALAARPGHASMRELRVGQRFDHFGHTYEILKINRDKNRTVQIARPYMDRFGKVDFIDHRSFPTRDFDRQHLRPID